MQVTFSHKRQEAPHIYTFFFTPSHKVHYTAGQYIELTVPHDSPDDRGIRRWFTLSSSPTDTLVSITTKIAEQHGSTFKHALLTLKPGTELTMAEPQGDFVLPKDTSRKLVFVAGGIGLTPFHSIVSELAAHQETRDIQFLHSVRREEDIVFEDTFKTHTNMTSFVSEPTKSWTGKTGSFSAANIMEYLDTSDDKLIYISGPEIMVEILRRDLQALGISSDQLVTDDFPGYNTL